ncbi:MAG TPA: YfhO family protein [Candidatus Binatia bacterium]
MSPRFYRVAIALLPAVLVLFHWPWVVFDRPPNGADSLIFFPLVEEYRQWVTHGHLPLWSNSIFCGQPTALQSEPALLHPLRLLLLAFAGTRGEGLWLYLHALLAGIGMLAYARTLGASRMSALVVAHAAALGGPLAIHVSHPGIYAATAWIPVELWCIERIVAGNRALTWTIWLAGASGLQWLSGHAQVPILGAYVLGLYAVLRARIFREPGTEGRSLRPVALVALGLILGIGLAAFQLVPLNDVMRQTDRTAGMTFDASATGSLPPWGLLLPVLPAIYGPEGASDASKFWLSASGAEVGSWELHIYAGGVCALLALFAGLCAARRPLVRTHLALMAVAVVFALGRFTPAYRLAMHLPGIAYTRVPSRALAFVFFSGLALACVGWDALRERQGHLRAWQRLTVALVLTFLVTTIGASLVLRAGEGRLTELVLHRVEQKYLADSESADGRARAQQRAAELVRQLRSGANPLVSPLATNLAFLALAGWLVARWRAAPSSRQARWSGLVLLALVADLLWFQSVFGTRAADDPAPRSPPPYLHAIDRSFRVLSLIDTDDMPRGASWRGYREALVPNFGAVWGIDSPEGTTSTGPLEFRAPFMQLHPYTVSGSDRLRAVVERRALLQVVGVGYVLTRPEWGALPWPLVFEDASVRLWRVPDALPQGVLVSLGDLDAPRWKDAFMDAAAPGARDLLDSLATTSIGTVTARPVGDADEAAFAVQAPRAGTFFRSTRFDAGWDAQLDGAPVEIMHAVGSFQGVAIPPGSHLLRFAYRPRSFRVGLAISSLVAATLVLLAFVAAKLQGPYTPSFRRR